MSVDLNHFRATTKPSVTTGKLGVVLAQITPNFKNQSATRSYLEWLLASFWVARMRLPSNTGHPNPRAHVVQRARRAARENRPADILTPGHQI